MRAELPWNVAGIAPEAREAARAAARREGMSVGEWLTRRILRDLSDLALFDDDESLAKRRDSEEILVRLKEAEEEATQSYRRIEQRLRLVGTDFDTAGRSQSESNRAMSRAANEIHSAGREQAEAFEQLGRHVANLEQRLNRLEQSLAQDGLKEAVKGLHQGLTRLASELSQATGRSGVQIASLARNLEQLALRLVAARGDAENATKLLDARLALMEEAHQVTADVIDRALENWDEVKTGIPAQVEAYSAGHQEALQRIEEQIGREQARQGALVQRVDETERALSQVIASLERDPIAELTDYLAKMSSRLEWVETNHDAMLVELSARMAEVAQALAAHEQQGLLEPPAGDAPSEAASDQMAPEEQPEPAADESVATDHNVPTTLEEAPREYFNQDNEPDEAFGIDFKMSEGLAEALARPASFKIPANDASTEEDEAPIEPACSPQEDFLRAARLSVRAQSEAEAAGLRFRPWRPLEQKGGSRYLALLAIAFLLLLGAAALIMLSRPPDRTDTPAVPEQKVIARKTAPALLQTVPALPPRAPANAETPPSPNQDANAQPASPSASVTDKVLAAANGGDAAAETVLGLKYLDSATSDPVEARKWLEKAAAAGQPVAQYRLGTLYERGQGVAANAALAVKWYLAAAQQGNRKAMHNLAVAYAEGAAGPKNMAEAARWFARAAALGLSDSQFNLAVLYERGDGVPQSLADAYEWYAIAAAQGDGESKTRLSVLQMQLPPAERASAMRIAQDFHPAPLDRAANLPPEPADFGS